MCVVSRQWAYMWDLFANLNKMFTFSCTFFRLNSCKNGPLLKNKSEKSQTRNANKQVKKKVLMD